jgi:hypothetical protein
MYGQLSADLVSDQPNAPTGKFTFSDKKYRLENFEHPAKIFLISNIETNQTIVFNPEDSTYIIDLTKDDAGTETINGLECKKTIFNKLSSGEEVLKVVQWKSFKYGITVKLTYNLPQGEGYFELTNIVEETVDKKLFQIPSLYTKRQ